MEQVPPGIDPDVPSAARIYDFFLGGKENFAVDRAVAQKLLELSPNIKESARANRRFLVRAVEYLADQGIRQFLDIGTGLPTQENVHEVALRKAPDSRIVYVDNDPIVLAHARALLGRNPQVAVAQGDLREPESILDNPEVTERTSTSTSRSACCWSPSSTSSRTRPPTPRSPSCATASPPAATW